MTHGTTRNPRQPGQKSGWRGAIGCMTVVVIIVLIFGFRFVSGMFSGDGGSGPVLLTRSDEQTLSDDLAQATRYQHICYGWKVTLDDDYSHRGGTTAGSNQGPGRPLDTSRCERWVTLTAFVTWTSSSSTSPDSGRYRLRSSANLDTGTLTGQRLGNVGFSVDRLVSDPAIATENLMEALPLLMAESGAAKPLPVQEGTRGQQPVAQPVEVNSDRWRNGKFMIIFGGLAIVAAIGCLVAGLVIWRRRKAHEGPTLDADPPTEPLASARPASPQDGAEASEGHHPPSQDPKNPPAP